MIYSGDPETLSYSVSCSWVTLPASQAGQRAEPQQTRGTND